MMIARTIFGLMLALLVSTTRFAQQLPPAPPIPEITPTEQPGSYRPIPTFTIPKWAAPSITMVGHRMLSCNHAGQTDTRDAKPVLDGTGGPKQRRR
jgi:hypothetical protein